MLIKSTIMIDGELRIVNVNPKHIVYYFRDPSSSLVRMRLVDGGDAVTDLRLSRVDELVNSK